MFYLFFPAGGIGKYTHQLLMELAQYKDLDIEVACLPDYQWRENKHYKTWPGLLGISHKIPVLRRLRFLLAQFISPRRMLKRAIAGKVDIIHICNINHLSFPFWRGLLDKWPGKLVCSAHDIRRSKPILNGIWEERQLKRFYRRCDGLLVHSRRQAQELVEYAGVSTEIIHVVPHGPNVYGPPSKESQAALRAQYGVSLQGQVALFFGYIRKDKNLDGLIRGLHLAQVQDLHLLVAGNPGAGAGAYLEECLQLIKDLGLEERISLELRYIPDEEIPSLLGLCDWVATTHGPGFSSQSGVLNLAAHYQRPVLATPTASFSEMLEETAVGELCPGFSHGDIAEGIRSISQKMRAGCAWDFTAYQARYSWASNAAVTRNLYGRLKVG